MTYARVKVQAIGECAGVILPKEVLDELQAGVGDTLHLVRTEHGFELTACDPAVEEAGTGFEVIRQKHANAFRELSR